MPAIDPRLTLAYTDKNKNKWYTFTPEAVLPWRRFMTGNIADFFLKKGLPDTFLRKVISLGKDTCMDTKKSEKQRLQDNYDIWRNLEMRLGYVCGEEQYLRLAAVYYLLPDEPIDVVHEAFTQRKIELWAQDEAAKDFFLQWAFSRTMGLADISLKDIRNYLSIAKEREMNIPTLPAG